MHTSAFDIPKYQIKLRGVEHTRKKQMFVQFKKNDKVQKDTTLLRQIVCLCKQKIKEICETNYYGNGMSCQYLITLNEIVNLK